MFATIWIPSDLNDKTCTKEILNSLKSKECPDKVIDKLLRLREQLTWDKADDCGVSPLSIRSLIRVVRRARTNDDLSKVLLQQVFVSDLLPPIQRAALESLLEDSGIPMTTSLTESNRYRASNQENKIELSDDICQIGSFQMPRNGVARPEMVPSPRFFDIPHHTSTIKDLLLDWSSGERAFLILGNQGTSSNKSRAD